MSYELKDTILYLDKVELGYGHGHDYKCILKDVNLIEKDVVREGHITGQVIAIVGRSGRGKSTLFKALTGLVKPKNGRVLVTELDSEIAGDAKEVAEGDIGFVDQKYTLFRHKTVFQTLMSAQRKSKKSKTEKKEVVAKYLTEWGLVNQKDQYPCELSGGQRQRTAIIEQILSSGHFMVLDEPFSGLDVGNIKSAKEAFELIKKDHELNTIIYSTHDIRLAVELADSIYVVGHKDGNSEYSTIVKHYDLKEMGLAWQEYGPKHLEFQKELTTELENS
jgi:ABC-type nitrate/sulfonate/bicarbonate transport system ATPase subunit